MPGLFELSFTQGGKKLRKYSGTAFNFFIPPSSAVFWSLLFVLFGLFECFQSQGQKGAFLCHVSVALTPLAVTAAGSSA